MIYVFKTSIKSRSQLRKLKPQIDRILPNGKWNLDFQDSDKILRIDSEQVVGLTLIDLLKSHNVHCEELE
jgi:hypothetical protein